MFSAQEVVERRRHDAAARLEAAVVDELVQVDVPRARVEARRDAAVEVTAGDEAAGEVGHAGAPGIAAVAGTVDEPVITIAVAIADAFQDHEVDGAADDLTGVIGRGDGDDLALLGFVVRVAGPGVAEPHHAAQAVGSALGGFGFLGRLGFALGRLDRRRRFLLLLILILTLRGQGEGQAEKGDQPHEGDRTFGAVLASSVECHCHGWSSRDRFSGLFRAAHPLKQVVCRTAANVAAAGFSAENPLLAPTAAARCKGGQARLYRCAEGGLTD